MSALIVVVGATGIQGNSVVNAFLQDGTYLIRGVTRDTTSAKAKELASQGVEMVSANADDEESLVAALQDATVIYAVTNFFAPFAEYGPERAMEIEYGQGTNLARAASRTPSLEHYIWSTIPSSSVISNGKWRVPHFEGKARVDEYIKTELKETLLPKTTFFWVSFYASNFNNYPMWTPTFFKPTGKYLWLQPVRKNMPITTIADANKNIGAFVLRIVQKPELTVSGKTVLASTETIPYQDVLNKWASVTGKPVHYVEISVKDYNALWPVWGEEFSLMLKFWETAGSKSWTTQRGDKVLKGDDLGLSTGDGLVSLEETLRAMDWSSVL